MAWLSGSGGWGNNGGWGSGRGNGNWRGGTGSWGQFLRDNLSTIIDRGVSSLFSNQQSSDGGSNPPPPSDSDDSGGSVLQKKVLGFQVSTLLVVALGYYVYQSS